MDLERLIVRPREEQAPVGRERHGADGVRVRLKHRGLTCQGLGFRV